MKVSHQALLRIVLIILLISIHSPLVAQDLLRLTTFGGLEDESSNAVVLDDAANIYVSGGFAGTVDFGGEVLTSMSSTDMFVTKYDRAHRLLWAQQAGGNGTGVVMATGIDLDPSGNVLVVGVFSGSAFCVVGVVS